MNNPEYVKVDDKLYKINTDFRVALKCNKVAEDTTISDTERAMAIIYMLFGEDGLNCENQNKLFELAMKYLLFGKDIKSVENENKAKYELDFDKCVGLIKASFKYDYKYDPYELEYLHWYNFYNDLESLSTSEFGNCCILNRVTNILNQDLREIKDSKTRQSVQEAQRMLKKKYCKSKEKEISQEQVESAIEFYKALGIEL